MKRLADLTAEDLMAIPVWRYEGGCGADALVVPAKRESLSREDDEIFLAATDFELFDSTRYSGFCFPADDSGIDYLQPVIINGSCHVNFWFDGPVAAETLERQWKTLGKQASDIFPVAFRCLVPVDGRIVSGRIAGVKASEPLTSEAPIGETPGYAEPTESKEPTRSSQSMERVLTARPVGARRGSQAVVDKRTARRRRVEMPVEFTQGLFYGTGVTGDVSRRGMFVRSTQIPGTGPMLQLTVGLPGGRKLVLKGRVVRGATSILPSPTSLGFGLRLADDWPDYEELLARLRDKLKS